MALASTRPACLQGADLAATDQQWQSELFASDSVIWNVTHYSGGLSNCRPF